jgi:acyl carrier protein
MTGARLDAAEVAARVREFIRAELMRNPTYALSDHEPLITGGLIDSFSLAHLGVFIEIAFGVYIPDFDLTVEQMDSVAQIVARILAG